MVPRLVLLLTTAALGCRAPQTPTAEQARQRDQELLTFNAWRAWDSSGPPWLPAGSTPDDYARQQFWQQTEQPAKR